MLLYYRALSASLVSTMLLATSAIAQVDLSGAASQSPPSADRGGRILVGFEGLGSATISGGSVVTLESALLPPNPPDDRDTIIATSPFFLVGEQAGGIGSAVIEGAGTSLVLQGNENTATLHTGNRGGTGTLEIRDGALVRVLDLAPAARTVSDLGTAIFTGARGGTGTLLVDNASAEVVSTFGAFMFIGDLGGNGTAVIRNGSSLSITEIASTEAGNDGNGASIVVGRARADEGGGGGTGSLVIDGSTVSITSANAVAQLVAGREDGTFGSVQLTNGAQVSLSGAQALVQIGQDGGSQGILAMDGGAVLSLDGGGSASPLRVGAAFTDFGRDEGGSGVLQMTGAGTRLEVIGNAIVGAPEAFGGGNGSGIVSVSQGATLQAGTVFLGTGGALVGNGGIIDANVTLDGGVIAPGLSPGSLSVLGDLTALSGIFDFEFAGAGPGQFDQLNIFGNLSLSEQTTFRFSFLDGFLPEDGAVLDFLTVEGDITGASPNVVFEGVGDDLGLSLFARDGTFALARNDPFIPGGPGNGDGNGETVAPIPLPASALLLLTGVAGIISVRRRRRHEV